MKIENIEKGSKLFKDLEDINAILEKYQFGANGKYHFTFSEDGLMGKIIQVPRSVYKDFIKSLYENKEKIENQIREL